MLCTISRSYSLWRIFGKSTSRGRGNHFTILYDLSCNFLSIRTYVSESNKENFSKNLWYIVQFVKYCCSNENVRDVRFRKIYCSCLCRFNIGDIGKVQFKSHRRILRFSVDIYFVTHCHLYNYMYVQSTNVDTNIYRLDSMCSFSCLGSWRSIWNGKGKLL